MHSLDQSIDASLCATAVILLGPLRVLLQVAFQSNIQSLEISVLDLQLVSLRQKTGPFLVELVDLLCKVVCCLLLVIFI